MRKYRHMNKIAKKSLWIAVSRSYPIAAFSLSLANPDGSLRQQQQQEKQGYSSKSK